MDVEKWIREDIDRLRTVIDAELDKGKTDGIILSTAATMLSERKMQLATVTLWKERPDVLWESRT